MSASFCRVDFLDPSERDAAGEIRIYSRYAEKQSDMTLLDSAGDSDLDA